MPPIPQRDYNAGLLHLISPSGSGGGGQRGRGAGAIYPRPPPSPLSSVPARARIQNSACGSGAESPPDPHQRHPTPYRAPPSPRRRPRRARMDGRGAERSDQGTPHGSARSVAERVGCSRSALALHALHESPPRFCSAWQFARSVA